MRMLSLRLDEKTEKELNYIKLTLNESQSLVVKEAIHAYYETLVAAKSHKSAADIFMDSGYIGSFKAEKDLSFNYKGNLTKGLEKKHGLK
jgi:hypothetical protein